MRGLVIVHERDLRQVGSLVTPDGQLTGEIWDIENSTFDCCKFYIKSDRTGVLVDAAGRQIQPEQVAQRYSVIILIAAHHSVDDQRLLNILNDFLHGKGSPPWANETVVVLSVMRTAKIELERSGLPSSQRVFFAPSEQLSDPPEFTSSAWAREVHSSLGRLAEMIDENQTRNPNVGFGLLLVDRHCNCFLMERERDPGRGKLGTIGGNFERGHSTAEELTRVLERRFHEDRGPEVDLGPLLSCTNMKNDFLHYIDLTFLAIVKGGGVSDVLDRELRLVSREKLKLLTSDNPRTGSNSGAARRMFTLREVAVFYRADQLFTPVANAFEALCRTIFTEQLRHGPRERIFFPSLIDNGRLLDLQLNDPDCVREIVASMRDNKNALPFFESVIS